MLALVLLIVELFDIVQFWDSTESCLRSFAKSGRGLVAIRIRATKTVSRFVHFYEINLNSKVSHLISEELQQPQQAANQFLRTQYGQICIHHRLQTYSSLITGLLLDTFTESNALNLGR